MKKKIICLLLSTLMIVTLISCESTVTKESAIDKLEGIGTITQNSEINEYIQRNFSESSNFIPLEYDNGVVKGVISPIRVSKWDYYYNSRPMSDKEITYVYKMYSINNGMIEALEDTYDVSKTFLISTEIDTGKLIIKKGNEKLYEYNPVEEFNLNVLGESEYTSYDINGEEQKEIYLDYTNSKGEFVSLGTNVIKINSKYTLVNLMIDNYTTQTDNYLKQFVIDVIDNKVYECPINSNSMINMYNNPVKIYNDSLYMIDVRGTIYRLDLNNENVKFEEIINIKLNQDEFLGDYYTLGLDTTSEGDLFCTINKRLTDNSFTTTKYIGVNLKTKEIKDLGSSYPNTFNIESSIKNSDFLLATESDYQYGDKRWIVKYKNGRFEKIQMIEKKKPNTSYREFEVESVLYDDDTNSFFLKRRLNDKDKGNYYSYEYLTIN